MLSLLEFLNSIYPVGPEIQALLSTMLKENVVYKGKYWLKEMAVCDKIAFVQKGLMRIFFESGSREVCLWYNRENDVILSVYSFFSQTPSQFAIQAVEDTTVLSITYQQLQEVYGRFKDFNVNGRKILEHYYSLSEMHVKLLLQPVSKRIEVISKLYPWMLEDRRITDKMMAAYIGVSHEHLSRFKGKRKQS
jgi:CRP-like cAMP-binding protein